MSPSDPVKTLLSTLEKRYGGLRSLDEERPLDQLVLAILSKGVAAKRAVEALEGLRGEFVDWNEVRVTALHDIELAVAALGTRGVQDKAALIRDVLATIYSRYNRVDLDFLTDKNDKMLARKRERLFNYLEEKSPAYPVLLQCYLNGRQPAVVVNANFTRVLGRVGLGGKGTTPARLRKQIEENLTPGDQLVFTTGVYHVANEHCHRLSPDCAGCPLKKICKAAPTEIEKARVAAEKERERARIEARKLAAKLAAEARMRKKAEDKRRRAEEAERRKAEARKKAEAKKKAAAKKAEAKKKAAAKKKAPKKAAAASTKTSTRKTSARKTSATRTAATKTATKKVAKTTSKQAAKKKTAKKKTAKKKAAKKTTRRR